MSLYKRGNTWWVRFTAPNGERIRRSAGTEDKQTAQEYHDQLKVELWRIYRLGEKPRRTWQEAIVRWMQDKDEKADRYKDVAKLKWFDPFLRDHYLDEINRDVIDHIGATKKAEASASTANRYLALLRAILRRARDDWEWVDAIPRIRLYPEPKKRVRWITQAQAATLVSELPPHLAAMAAFTLATGLRQANVSYLRWDQVDLKRCTAWIHADQSKSRRAIAVPLNEDALCVLSQQLGKHPVFVFTYKDKPVARTSTKAWKHALARAGIENFRWHDLRHTWASWHVQAGTSLQELMELGGWASYEMVLRYAHLASEHLRDAAKRVDGTKLTQRHQKKGLKLIVTN
jgi:integrase